MGSNVEFNPDLALRNISEAKNGRKREECIPEKLETERIYDFLKEGQRNYWLQGEIPLLETKGGQQLSKPIASIIILESTHFLHNGMPWTKGKYRVIEIFKDNSIHFNGFSKV